MIVGGEDGSFLALIGDGGPHRHRTAPGGESHPILLLDPQARGISGIHLGETLRADQVDFRGLTGHAAEVVAGQIATGGEGEGVLLAGQFHRRQIILRDEEPLAPGKGLGVQDRGAGMVLVGHRPLQTNLVQAGVGDTFVLRQQRADLLEDLLGRVVLHLVAHLAGQFAENLPVGPGLARRFDSLADPLHPSLGAGESPVLFGVTGGREHHIGHLGGIGQEDILHHHEIRLFPRPSGHGRYWGRPPLDPHQRCRGRGSHP